MTISLVFRINNHWLQTFLKQGHSCSTKGEITHLALAPNISAMLAIFYYISLPYAKWCSNHTKLICLNSFSSLGIMNHNFYFKLKRIWSICIFLKNTIKIALRPLDLCQKTHLLGMRHGSILFRIIQWNWTNTQFR